MSSLNDEPIISEEQQRYATWLNWGMRSGLAILVLSFLAYVLGWLPAHFPLEQLPSVWGLPTAEYLKQTNSPTGWDWLQLIGNGDFAGLIGIAWLSGCSLLCLIVVLPIYARRKEWWFVTICISALFVQVFAASGILSSIQ